MRIGLLWFDGDSGKGLAQKIESAIERYRETFGRAPNTCYVHPKDLNGGEVSTQGVRIVAASNILRNHLWVGWDEDAESRAA